MGKLISCKIVDTGVPVTVAYGGANVGANVGANNVGVDVARHVDGDERNAALLYQLMVSKLIMSVCLSVWISIPCYPER